MNQSGFETIFIIEFSKGCFFVESEHVFVNQYGIIKI